MRVKTLKRHGYKNKRRAPGEEYEIKNPRHVQTLEAVGRVRRVAERAELVKPEQPKRKYKRRDMSAESTVELEPVKSELAEKAEAQPEAIEAGENVEAADENQTAA